MDLKTLHKQYSHFFTEDDAVPMIFYMAIDAEWYQDGQRNIVLSYQIATSCRTATNNIIYYTTAGKRLKLAEIIELGIKSVVSIDQYNEIALKKNIIVNVIAHNIVAEWSVLADRDEDYIIEHIQLIRGLPVTGRKPIKCTVGRGTPVDVALYDTMLLAPASHLALKKLSTLLGDDAMLKDDITQFYITHMHLYLKEHPKKFEQYALKDSAITLALFFLLQDLLHDLVKKSAQVEEGKLVTPKQRTLYKTLASAAVKSFQHKVPTFDAYRSTLKKRFQAYNLFASRAYYGGRNESYFVGRTNDYEETRDKIWIDIDFSGCYPTAMALAPMLNLNKEPEYIPRSYRLGEQEVAELRQNNVDETTIQNLKKALKKSVKDFDVAMTDLPSKKQSWRIREIVSIYDNRLIDRWWEVWKATKVALAPQAAKADLDAEHTLPLYSLPGFARVRFSFPKDTVFPCLPVRHEKYGLIFPLEGETVASAVEIMIALEAGAEIKALHSLEYHVNHEEDGTPILIAMDHLSFLVQERGLERRKGTSKGDANQKLLKEFSNSLYGKFAQAINPKSGFSPATNEYKGLPESPITEPIIAALTTSLARAALSDTLQCIARYNLDKSPHEQLTVVSATTDGFLLGVPSPKGYSVSQDYYDISEDTPGLLEDKVSNCLAAILQHFGCEKLLDEINQSLPNQMMRYSRNMMTGNDQIFEVKHLADEIVSIKTRGQIGLLDDGSAVLLARFGLKPPLSEICDSQEYYKYLKDTGGVARNTEEANWIMQIIQKSITTSDPDENYIQTYNFITLNSFSKIYRSQSELDFNSTTKVRKANADYDWKRKVLLNDDDSIIPFTVPYLNMTEMIAHRNIMESIRRQGKIASPQDVIHRLQTKGRVTRITGGTETSIIRMFLRGITQGHIPSSFDSKTYEEWAKGLNALFQNFGFKNKTWTVTDFKNAKRSQWESGYFNPSPQGIQLLNALEVLFQVPEGLAIKELIKGDCFQEVRLDLLRAVIPAILHAPCLGITPYAKLQESGKLPGKREILDMFRVHTSEHFLHQCFSLPYLPGTQPSVHRSALKRLFVLMGIPAKEAEKCASLLCETTKVDIAKKKRNPSKQTCAEQFCHAILQSDIANSKFSTKECLDGLYRYGVSKRKCLQLRQSRFNPNSLKNTARNRSQITTMAKSFKQDPMVLFDVLLEK